MDALARTLLVRRRFRSLSVKAVKGELRIRAQRFRRQKFLESLGRK